MSVGKNIIVGVLLASIFAGVMASYIGSMAQNSGLAVDNSSFNTTYNKMFEIANTSNSMGDEIHNAELESSSVLGVTTEGGYKAGKLLTGSTTVITGMTTELVSGEDSIGIPGWVITLTTVVISLTITLLILKAFWRSPT